MRIIILGLFLFVSDHLYADQPIELFQITCIGDMRYFEMESKSYSEAASYIGSGFEGRDHSDQESVKNRIELLEKNGLFLPEKLDYTCSLNNMSYLKRRETSSLISAMTKAGQNIPEKLLETTREHAKYRLVSRKDSPRGKGMCGGAPTASISLWRENEKWIDDVLVNDSCFGRPSITRIIINEGKKGWYTRNLTICIKFSSLSKVTCKYLSSTYGQIKANIPINSETLAKLIDK